MSLLRSSVVWLAGIKRWLPLSHRAKMAAAMPPLVIHIWQRWQKARSGLAEWVTRRLILPRRPTLLPVWQRWLELVWLRQRRRRKPLPALRQKPVTEHPTEVGRSISAADEYEREAACEERLVTPQSRFYGDVIKLKDVPEESHLPTSQEEFYPLVTKVAILPPGVMEATLPQSYAFNQYLWDRYRIERPEPKRNRSILFPVSRRYEASQVPAPSQAMFEEPMEAGWEPHHLYLNQPEESWSPQGLSIGHPFISRRLRGGDWRRLSPLKRSQYRARRYQAIGENEVKPTPESYGSVNAKAPSTLYHSWLRPDEVATFVPIVSKELPLKQVLKGSPKDFSPEVPGARRSSQPGQNQVTSSTLAKGWQIKPPLDDSFRESKGSLLRLYEPQSIASTEERARGLPQLSMTADLSLQPKLASEGGFQMPAPSLQSRSLVGNTLWHPKGETEGWLWTQTSSPIQYVYARRPESLLTSVVAEAKAEPSSSQSLLTALEGMVHYGRRPVVDLAVVPVGRPAETVPAQPSGIGVGAATNRAEAVSPDMDAIARDVYRVLKRRLARERERALGLS